MVKHNKILYSIINILTFCILIFFDKGKINKLFSKTMLVTAFELIDLTKQLYEKAQGKLYNDISFCYWVNLDLENIKEEILQIDEINSKLKAIDYDSHPISYLKQGDIDLPNEIYEDCMVDRYCGLLRV